ncbi:NACHT C-terminal alpha/beta 1 domain-containing protein [Planktothrix agardhii]|uniref:NACHT C-terminal alpha/beta 1 domain-containing protein n=1 Tax=Planktothrix agardhii TaxID=1160 RepID=UPI003969E9EB
MYLQLVKKYHCPKSIECTPCTLAWLTDKSLEAPLKGFPPHQPNLLSAIQTWLEET